MKQEKKEGLGWERCDTGGRRSVPLGEIQMVQDDRTWVVWVAGEVAAEVQGLKDLQDGAGVISRP